MISPIVSIKLGLAVEATVDGTDSQILELAPAILAFLAAIPGIDSANTIEIGSV